jgi:hypothetical protein
MDEEQMSALNRARAQAMLHTPAPEAENKDEQAQAVSAEQKDEQTVKGTVKSVDGKKVTITIGEKTYTFENNKDDLKLQKGDKVSVVLVKDAEGKEQVKSVKLLPAEADSEKAQDQKDGEKAADTSVETAQAAVEE